MKNKAKFLIKQSIKKKMNTKWFKVVNVILLILLVAIINIDNIISYFGGDFEEENKIYVIDEVNAYEPFNNYFKELSKDIETFSNYELVHTTDNEDDLKEKIKENNDIIVSIRKDDINIISAKVTSYDPVDSITEQIINSSLTAIKTSYSLVNSGLTEEELIKISNPIEIEKELTNPELDENAEAKDILSAGTIIIFIIPFFILVILIVQMIGAEINDEKTTRGMEIIISNVSPKVHFLTKILATTFFAVSQCLLIFAYGLVGLLVRKLLSGSLSLGTNTSIASSLSGVYETLKNSGMLESLIKAAPILIIIFLLSFLVYALLAGILASMTTSIEDYQQLQTPLMIIIMIGYYIALMASVFEGSIFIKILSYLPFLSALIAPVTFLLGQTTIIDLFITCGVLILSCYLLLHYGIRIYKVGILNYSSKDLWKKVFKSLRNKE